MSLMQLARPAAPLSPTDLLRWTLRIYLRRLPTWLVLIALTVIPLAAFNVLVNLWQAGLVDLDKLAEALRLPPDQNPLFTDPDLQFQVIQVGLSALAAQVITLLVQSIVIGGVGAALAAAEYRGRTASLLDAARQALAARAPALLSGHGIAFGVLIALILASMLLSLFCVGFLGFGVAAYIYLAWIPLMAPVMVLERGPLGRLLARVWYFGKKRVWIIFGAFVGLLAFGYLLSLPVGWLMDAVVTWVQPSDALYLVLVQVGTLIVQAITLPLGAILYTLLYEDARARLEPSDLGTAPDGEAADPPEPPVTAGDISTMLGVSLAALTLLFVLYMALMTMGTLSVM